MDLLRKLRTLLGALAHKPSAPPSPANAGEGTSRAAQGQEDHATALPARPTLQDKGSDSPEEGRVADLIEQQKNASDRSE